LLLINFFKKASGVLFCFFGRLLMLFLFPKVKTLILICLSVFFFFNTFTVFANLKSDNLSIEQIFNLKVKSIAIVKATNPNDINEENTLNRIDRAEESLQFQKSNLKIYQIIAVLIITGLLFFIINRFKDIKKQHLVKERNFITKLLKIKIQNRLQEQQLLISKSLYQSLNERFAFLLNSLKNIQTEFEIKDKALEDEIKSINVFVEKAQLEFQYSVKTINKLEALQVQ
jgi:hypothetical protein